MTTGVCEEGAGDGSSSSAQGRQVLSHWTPALVLCLGAFRWTRRPDRAGAVCLVHHST